MVDLRRLSLEFLLVAGAAFFVLFVSNARAQNVECPLGSQYEYAHATTGSVWEFDHMSVAQGVADFCLGEWEAGRPCLGTSGNASLTYHFDSWVTVDSSEPYNGTHTFKYCAEPAAQMPCDPLDYSNKSLTLSYRTALTCPTPDECDTSSPNIGKTYSYEVPWAGGATPDYPPGYCDSDTNCRAVKSGPMNICLGGSCFGSYTLSDQNCTIEGPSGPEPDPEVEDPPVSDPDPEWGTTKCAESSGQEYCFAGSGQQCGYLNSEYVCLTHVDADDCVTYASGQTLCGALAGTPPAPSTPADPFIKAEPDLEITGQTPTGQEPKYDVYTAATTAAAASTAAGATGAGGSASTPPPTGSGSVGGSDTDGDGYADGEDEETAGTASGGEDCVTPPACEGDAIQCAILKAQWLDRCDWDVPQSEIDSVMDAIIFNRGAAGDGGFGSGSTEGETVDVSTLDASGYGSAGACPQPLGITVMGANISLDIWTGACDMAVTFAPFVMLMGYLMAGLLFVRGGV